MQVGTIPFSIVDRYATRDDLAMMQQPGLSADRSRERLLVLGRRMMSSRRMDALRLLGSFELRAYTEEADSGRCQNDRDCGCEF